MYYNFTSLQVPFARVPFGRFQLPSPQRKTLNIFWGKIFPPRENWANFPSEGEFSLWGIIFPWKIAFPFPRSGLFSHEMKGLRKRSFCSLRENLWLSPARENLPQAIFFPQKMLWEDTCAFFCFRTWITNAIHIHCNLVRFIARSLFHVGCPSKGDNSAISRPQTLRLRSSCDKSKKVIGSAEILVIVDLRSKMG